MKKILSNNLKWILVGILLFCFTMIAIFMVTDKVKIYDDFVYNIVSKCINTKMTAFAKLITNFVNPITIGVLTLIISYIIGIKGKDKKGAILFCLNLVLIAILNYILKNIFARSRPEFINIIEETGYSFPSGHSAVSMAFYGYIIYLINSKCTKKSTKYITSFLIGLLIFLIGISRIYLGVHYASDVTAAFMLSLSYVIVYIHITEWLLRKENNN